MTSLVKFLEDCKINKNINITEHILNENSFINDFSLGGRIAIFFTEIGNDIKDILIEGYQIDSNIILLEYYYAYYIFINDFYVFQ